MIHVESAPPADQVWLVRCRFGSPEELHRHLLLGGGFLVPQRAIGADPGGRTIVEIGFPDAPDRALLHGWVRGQSNEGVWVDVHALARWAPGPEAPHRRHRRLACDLFAEVRPTGAQPWLCRALDVSEGGLRLSAGSLELGLSGDEVALTLLRSGLEGSLAELRARVVWAGVREAGLELLEASPGFEALLLDLKARWESVRELTHDAGCACSQPARRAG